MTTGLKALLAALAETGRGEEGGNNAGPDVERYRRGKGPDGPWCAAFVAYCLEEAGFKFTRSHSAKKLFHNLLRAGACRVDCRPEPGDIVLWHRGAANAAAGHIGIVSRVEGNAFWAIEGNKGWYPSKVDEYQHALGEALLLGFIHLPE